MPYENFRILLDLPADQPALGFDQYAEALRQIIEGSRPQFAVGIFGTWGSGKSTLMEAIEGRLDQENVIPVRFSAWRYEKEEHLIVPLLDTLREALVAWSEAHVTLKDQAAKAASTIGKVMHSILSGLSFKLGLPGAVDATFKANEALAAARQWDAEEKDARVSRSFYHASFRALNDALKEFLAAAEDGAGAARRFVVFVDDLDRCQPAGALEVLESMKLFFDLEGFVFVVGLDRRVVESVIDSKYARDGLASEEDAERFRIRGSDYIRKIFQVPFTLAPVSIGQLDEFLESLFIAPPDAAESPLPPEQIEDLRQTVAPHLRYLVTEIGVNPREIKRFVNSYTLQMKVKCHLDAAVVLAFQTIAFRRDWELVQRSLYAYREVFLNTVRGHLDGEDDALENLDPELVALPQSFLTYVSNEGPGHPLLAADPLDEYIYSGEATRSTLGPAFLDLIRDVARLRGKFRELRDEAIFKSESKEADVASSMSKPLYELQAHVRKLYKQVMEYASSVSGPSGRLAVQGMERLDQSLEKGLPETPGDWDRWLDENEKLARQTMEHLMDVYQSGQVGSDATA